MSPLDILYITLGQIFAAVLFTALALGLLIFAAYICALIEIRHERNAQRRKETRNAKA